MNAEISKVEYEILLFMPPAKMLAEADINLGFKVLNYGCGPGKFTIMIAEIIGQSGIVCALDIHPLAIEAVEQKAHKKDYSNSRGKEEGLFPCAKRNL